IGLVNEMAIVCDKLGVDVWEVIEAAATKPFGFMKFTPGPGVGGHCIPLDPHYLAWKMRTLNYRTRFIELAGEINAEMPEYWVGRVVDRLNEQGRAARGSRVLVVGVAYKKDIDDVRESPALDVIRLLQRRGAAVSYHDPHVVRNQRDGRLEFTTDLGGAVERSDVIFIAVGTPATEDGSADLQHVLDVARTIGQHMDRSKLVVTKSTVPVGTAERVRAEI